jgi:hypothetical protein
VAEALRRTRPSNPRGSVMGLQEPGSRYVLKQPLIPIGVAGELVRVLVNLKDRLERTQLGTAKDTARDAGKGSLPLTIAVQALLAEVARGLDLAELHGKQLPAARWEVITRCCQIADQELESLRPEP